MSFQQNTSNQRAPQEQSEPEANSSSAPRRTGAPTAAQSEGNAAPSSMGDASDFNYNDPINHGIFSLPRQDSSMPSEDYYLTLRWRGTPFNVQSGGNAASFTAQYELNINPIHEHNNDNDLFLQGLLQEMVNSFSNLELYPANGSNSNEDPLVRKYLPALYSSVNSKQFSKSDLIELLDSLSDGLRGEATMDFQGSSAQPIEIIARLEAQDIVLKYLAAEFPKHGYCDVFKEKLMTLKSYIDLITRNIGLNIRSIDHMETSLNAISASIASNIETLKTWDSRECFLCGQSEKFANVVCAKDLLPQNDGPTTCGICLSTIEETSDFAVQSECTHIFCTPCITTWFETQQDCPMCRQSGVFMSKDRLLELGSSGPEPAH